MPAPKSKQLSDSRIGGKLPAGAYIDGEGLRLQVSASGTKTWQLRYRLNGKGQTFTIGQYPTIRLAKARELAQDARSLVALGQHPKDVRDAQRAAAEAARGDTFGKVVEDWLEVRESELLVSSMAAYRSNLKPVLAAWKNKPVAAIDRYVISDMLKSIKARSTKAGALRLIREILDDAAEAGRIELNPARAYKFRLPEKPKTQHHKALLIDDNIAATGEAIGEYLRRVDTYPEHNGPVIKRALLLNAYLPARPGELIAMRWADIDLKRAEWRYTQSKVDEPHVMHLPRQVVALLREWKLQAGKGEWVFPSPKVEGKHIAKCTLPWARASADMYGARGVVSGHGWRAAFRTVARETLKCEPAILELAIGHGVDKASTSGLGRAYSREQMMDDRRQALQRWADWLDSLRG